MSKPRQIHCLTSLRFVAAALIVLGHAGNAPWASQFKFDLFNAGNGVSFFYVLSGFILAHTYHGMGRRELGSYFVARVARIWPVHLFTLAVAAVVFTPGSLAAGSPLEVVRLMTNALLLQSWVPYSDWFYSYNAVSWSLSTEVGFYLVFPVRLLLLRRKWQVLAVAAAVLLCGSFLVCIALDLPPRPSATAVSASSLLYISPIGRLAEFVAGMLAWRVVARADRTTAGVGATLAEIGCFAALLSSLIICHRLYLRDPAAIPGGVMGWVATAGSFLFTAALIAVLSRERGLIARVLALRPFVYLGELSFAVYMTHQMLLNFITLRLGEQAKAAPQLHYALYWTATLVVSALVFHAIEKPSRAAIRRLFARTATASLKPA